MPATIKDVAKRAGVSIATVSKMINGGNVLEDNRIAIEQAIEELNYRVNTVARGMKTRRSMTVGVLIPSLADYYGVSVLSSIDRELYKRGYSTIICDYSETDPDGARMKLDFLLNKQVDGIIMQPINVRKKDLIRIEAENTPIVFIDVGVEDSGYDSVTIDNEGISFEVTEHLLQNGHKRVGLMVGAPGVRTTDDRVTGYHRALMEAGIVPDPALCSMIDISEESGYIGMRNLLSMKNPPTAVFTAGHDLTLGALRYLNEAGKRIPEDISFVGFETQTVARIYHPKLTIGLQPIMEIGRTASEFLFERMSGEYTKSARDIHLKASIELGASVLKI
ncbi:MAG: LacI family DNA-binding transcriptional regulator [Oscillospiraceae bacterium]|jgi:DNA-binding LacI/PurR family transcriptional regulator|nr:LacI family DNA-binding transcriptional regulator [Oscillospiraceae bacterium]